MCTTAQLIAPHLHHGQPVAGARFRGLDVESHDPNLLEEFAVALMTAAQHLRSARAVHAFTAREDAEKGAAA